MTFSDELYHFGIKGMRWGIRRTPEQLGHRQEKKRLRAEAKAERKRKRAEAKLARKRNPNRLSNKIKDMTGDETAPYKAMGIGAVSGVLAAASGVPVYFAPFIAGGVAVAGIDATAVSLVLQSKKFTRARDASYNPDGTRNPKPLMELAETGSRLEREAAKKELYKFSQTKKNKGKEAVVNMGLY